MGAFAISEIAAKLPVSEKIESTGSDGGKAKLSTLICSSQSSLGVTLP